jgi:uncharacterized protein (TIGR04255 family)
MSDFPVFANPPITEALLDIHVELDSAMDISELATLQEGIAQRYPKRHNLITSASNMQIDAEGVREIAPPAIRPRGFLFLSPDERKVVQARVDGFTFNRLRPYERWRIFREEAWELWQRYINVAHPLRVVRVGLRYINRIELPLPFADLKEFVLTTPEIAPELPQGMAHFFMQLVIPHPEQPIMAVISQTMEHTKPDDQFVPLIFDIDVSRQLSVSPTSEEVQEALELLRDFKNTIFLKSMTDKAMELFK